MEPDFSKYNMEELEECLTAIDRVRYPDRVARIEERLDTFYTQEAKKIEAISPRKRSKIEKQSRNGSIFVLVICIFCCGLFLYTGEVPLRYGDDVTAKESPIMFYSTLTIFGFFAVWQAIKIHINRFK